ncbi:MAG: GntR family transcriptional regulator [Planctomycetota bacterium]
MKVNLKSSKPIFQQIVEGMQSAIAGGVYKAGERVPSTRDLAIKLKVNPNTVQKAYEELVRSGVLVSMRNRGKFVAKRAEHSATKQSELAIAEAFRNGVDIARASGLTNKKIKELLDRVIKASEGKAIA